jgi:hypothetical protein
LRKQQTRNQTFDSKSTTSLPIKVPVIFMSCSPILSNSFMKCWFMNFFNLNRPVSVSRCRLFMSMPIISIFYAMYLILLVFLVYLHSLNYLSNATWLLLVMANLLFFLICLCYNFLLNNREFNSNRYYSSSQSSCT